MSLNKNTRVALFAILCAISTFLCCFWVKGELKTLVLVTGIILVILLLIFSYMKRDADFSKNMILAAGFGVTIMSWFITGYINSQNAIKQNQMTNQQSILQKKRDLRTRFLLNAYLRLSNYDFRNFETAADSYIYGKYVESALTSVQLLGDTDLIRISNEFVLSNGKNHYNELLEKLRNELRSDLSLPELPISDTNLKVTVFRFLRNYPFKDSITSEQQIQLIIKLNELNQDLVK